MSLKILMDEIAKKTFGRTKTEAYSKGVCVSCGKAPEEFRDPDSRKEFEISQLCQSCQDEIFRAKTSDGAEIS
jgi:hypothetical protein